MTMVYRHMVDDPFYIVQVWESPLGYSASYVIPTGETVSETRGFQIKRDAILWGWGQVAFDRHNLWSAKEIVKLYDLYCKVAKALPASVDEFAATMATLHRSFSARAIDVQKAAQSLSRVIKEMEEEK